MLKTYVEEKFAVMSSEILVVISSVLRIFVRTADASVLLTNVFRLRFSNFSPLSR
jgi:hypothetical protein